MYNIITSYFSSEFWDERGDPLTSQFFGMESPSTFFTIGFLIISWITFHKFISPISNNNNKGSDLRPAMIILNGISFGAYTAGVFLALILTGGLFGDRWSCSAYDPYATDITSVTIKYLGYLFIWTKVFDFLRPVLSILSGKEHKVTILQLSHLQISLMLVWIAAKTNPGGIFVLIALNDIVYQLLASGYLVMMAASPEMRPDRSFVRKFLVFKQISVFLVLCFQLYFLMEPSCSSSFPLLMTSTIYSVLQLIFYPMDYRSRLEKNALFEHRKMVTSPQKVQWRGKRVVVPVYVNDFRFHVT